MAQMQRLGMALTGQRSVLKNHLLKNQPRQPTKTSNHLKHSLVLETAGLGRLGQAGVEAVSMTAAHLRIWRNNLLSTRRTEQSPLPPDQDMAKAREVHGIV
jgi:hypothetical protein